MGARLEKLVTAWALVGGVLLIAIVLVTSVNVSAFTVRPVPFHNLQDLFGDTRVGL